MKRARLFLVAALLLPTSRFLGAAPPEEKHSEDKGTKTTSKPRGDSISKDTLAGRELNRVGGSPGKVVGGANRGMYGAAGAASGSAKAGSRKAAKSSRTADSQKEKKSDSSKKQ